MPINYDNEYPKLQRLASDRKYEIERLQARVSESRKVVTDLMKSHDELMAGIGAIVVDYALLNECRIAGDKYLAALGGDDNGI